MDGRNREAGRIKYAGQEEEEPRTKKKDAKKTNERERSRSTPPARCTAAEAKAATVAEAKAAAVAEAKAAVAEAKVINRQRLATEGNANDEKISRGVETSSSPTIIFDRITLIDEKKRLLLQM